ncbi:MAG: hypothetical protein Q9219_005939 [cf. Caloplaca sp. 3 TL-2023]
MERQSVDRKGTVTVAEVKKPESVSRVTKEDPKATLEVGGAFSSLIQGALLPCVPVVVVSTALLTLILRHRVQLDSGWQKLRAPVNDNVWDSNLKDWILTYASTGGGSAYIIRYNPATLAAIASWTSKIIPLITGASMGVGKPVYLLANSKLTDDHSIESWNYTHAGNVWMKQGIKGAQQAAETLLENSPFNVVYNHTSHDGEEHFYLGDGAMGSQLDFLANTTSISTQCNIMTQDCEINPDGPGFTCPGYQSPSFTYPGQVGVDPEMAMASSNMSMTGIQFFEDIEHQRPIGLGNQTTDLFGLQNPMHFLTWSKGFPPIDTSNDAFKDMTRGNYLQLVNGDNVFILNCSSTIYRTVYAWVNGAIMENGQKDQGFYTSLAPPAYGAIFSAPFAIDSALGHLALQGAAALAAYKTEPQDVAYKFANEFSRAAVALTAGTMAPIPNMLEQSRNNTELLTRVPKVPLFFLIGIQILYAVASVFVAVLAWMVTRPREAQQVKSRLTVDGLAAALFDAGATQEKAIESIDDLYSEHTRTNDKAAVHKVGIKQTQAGGWVWVANGEEQKGRSIMKAEVDGACNSEGSTVPLKDNGAMKRTV